MRYCCGVFCRKHVLPILGLVGSLFIVRITLAQTSPKPTPSTQTAAVFDGDRSFVHLKNICALGRRFSTSRGMTQQQDYLRSHFDSLGLQNFMQPFVARNPVNGRNVELANLIVRFFPHRSKRLLICCHYDTRPFPDLDSRNPQGVFIGANDGGSGVAILCELAKHMQQFSGEPVNRRGPIAEQSRARPLAKDDGKYGVDFAFFDGEEFVYVARRDPMFLGATHFANQYVATGRPPLDQDSIGVSQRAAAALPPNAKYIFAILIDMVGDKNLQIYYEGNSLRYAPRLTKSIWDVAARMKLKEFVPKQKHDLRDDHLPLNQIARIPTCDIIDFDFPSARRKHAFWHTEADVVQNCSARSLGIVGSVLLQWLTEMQQIASPYSFKQRIK